MMLLQNSDMQLPATNQTSALTLAIGRARSLFDEGDFQAALLLSSGCYDQAKSAAAYASRVKASEQLIEKAHHLQADSLLIECEAKIALADEYDRAKEDGLVGLPGRPRNADNRAATIVEAGLSRNLIFQSRVLRDAEKGRPGIVASLIKKRLQAGLEPSRAHLKSALFPKRKGPRSVGAARIPSVTAELFLSLKWYELDSLLSEIRSDLVIVEAIKSHCVPSDDKKTVSEILGRAVLSAILRGETPL
jgi:hypothetical protein